MKRDAIPWMMGTEALIALPAATLATSGYLLPIAVWVTVSVVYLGLLKVFGSGFVIEGGLLALILAVLATIIAHQALG